MAGNNVSIKLDLSGQQQVISGLTQINNHITQINGSFNQTSDSSEGLFKKLLGFGTAIYAIDKVASSVASLGKTMLEVAVSTASANQQAQIGFTTLLGSASKANDFIGKLQKFAIATPFEFAGLQTSAQQLLAVGISANNIIPIMRSLGNATAAMGTGQEGIQRAIVAIQQMNAAQAIHAQDLNQLRDAGVPVYELLSKALGKTTKQVADLVQGGKLGQDALGKMMAALESGQGLERFNGMMAKQSKTLAGEWSTLHDTVTIGLGNAIKPLMPQLTSAVAGMVKLSDPLFKHLDDKAKELGVIAPMWIDYMQLKARQAWPHIEAFVGTFERVAGSIVRGAKAFGSGFIDAGGLKATKDLLHDIATSLGYIAHSSTSPIFHYCS